MYHVWWCVHVIVDVCYWCIFTHDCVYILMWVCIHDIVIAYWLSWLIIHDGHCVYMTLYSLDINAHTWQYLFSYLFQLLNIFLGHWKTRPIRHCSHPHFHPIHFPPLWLFRPPNRPPRIPHHPPRPPPHQHPRRHQVQRWATPTTHGRRARRRRPSRRHHGPIWW